MVNVGQRSPAHRLAHLLCEMMVRLDAAGLVKDGRCAWPLSPTNLADATGLDVDKAGRGLEGLATQGLAVFADGQLTIPDWDAVVHLAGFRSDYLHLLPRPDRLALLPPPLRSSSDGAPTSH